VLLLYKINQRDGELGSARHSVCVCVYVCVSYRERESVCVLVTKRESVCVRVSDRERERDSGVVRVYMLEIECVIVRVCG
jgi:hypothetical protein